jgi:hypothetical protein
MIRGTGSSDASIPFARETMSGGLIRSFQYLAISSNTSLVSVDGSPLTTMSASQTASCRLVTTLSGPCTCTRSRCPPYASCSSAQKTLPHAPAPTPTTRSGSPCAFASSRRSSSSLASAPAVREAPHHLGKRRSESCDLCLARAAGRDGVRGFVVELGEEMRWD